MAKDPKGRTEPGFETHVFICSHSRPDDAVRPSCGPRGSLEIMTELKRRVKSIGIESIRVQKSGCLDYCENGISCVIYPDSEWYSIKSEDDLESLLKRILDGDRVESIRMNMEEDQ